MSVEPKGLEAARVAAGSVESWWAARPAVEAYANYLSATLPADVKELVERLVQAVDDTDVPHKDRALATAAGALVTLSQDLTAANERTNAAVDDYNTALAKIEELLSGEGFVYFNEDSGEEYHPNHPVESGECTDATSIRRSTAQEDVLNSEMQTEFTARLTAEAAVTKLRAQLERARDVLKPFAAAVPTIDGDSLPDTFLIHAAKNSQGEHLYRLVAADFRAARSLIQEIADE